MFGDKAQLWLWSQKPEGKCCELVGQDIKDNQTLGIGVAAGLRKEDAKLRDALNKAFGEMMSRRHLQEDQREVLSVPTELVRRCELCVSDVRRQSSLRSG